MNFIWLLLTKSNMKITLNVIRLLRLAVAKMDNSLFKLGAGR